MTIAGGGAVSPSFLSMTTTTPKHRLRQRWNRQRSLQYEEEDQDIDWCERFNNFGDSYLTIQATVGTPATPPPPTGNNTSTTTTTPRRSFLPQTFALLLDVRSPYFWVTRDQCGTGCFPETWQIHSFDPSRSETFQPLYKDDQDDNGNGNRDSSQDDSSDYDSNTSPLLSVQLRGRVFGPSILEVFGSASGRMGQDVVQLSATTPAASETTSSQHNNILPAATMHISNQTIVLMDAIELGGREQEMQCQLWDGVFGLSPQRTIPESRGRNTVVANWMQQQQQESFMPKKVFSLFVDPTDNTLDIVTAVDTRPFVNHTTSEIVLGGVRAEHYEGCLQWHPLKKSITTTIPQQQEPYESWSVEISHVRVGSSTVPSSKIITMDTTLSSLVAPANFISTYAMEHNNNDSDNPNQVIICADLIHDMQRFQRPNDCTSSFFTYSRPKDHRYIFSKCSADLTPIEFVMEDGASYRLDKNVLLSKADPLMYMYDDNLPALLDIPKDDLCVLNIVLDTANEDTWILGQAFLHEIYVVFDFENFRLGMAPRRLTTTTTTPMTSSNTTEEGSYCAADADWILQSRVDASEQGTTDSNSTTTTATTTQQSSQRWMILVLVVAAAAVIVGWITRRRRRRSPLNQITVDEEDGLVRFSGNNMDEFVEDEDGLMKRLNLDTGPHVEEEKALEDDYDGLIGRRNFEFAEKASTEEEEEQDDGVLMRQLNWGTDPIPYRTDDFDELMKRRRLDTIEEKKDGSLNSSTQRNAILDLRDMPPYQDKIPTSTTSGVEKRHEGHDPATTKVGQAQTSSQTTFAMLSGQAETVRKRVSSVGNNSQSTNGKGEEGEPHRVSDSIAPVKNRARKPGKYSSKMAAIRTQMESVQKRVKSVNKKVKSEEEDAHKNDVNGPRTDKGNRNSAAPGQDSIKKPRKYGGKIAVLRTTMDSVQKRVTNLNQKVRYKKGSRKTQIAGDQDSVSEYSVSEYSEVSEEINFLEERDDPLFFDGQPDESGNEEVRHDESDAGGGLELQEMPPYRDNPELISSAAATVS